MRRIVFLIVGMVIFSISAAALAQETGKVEIQPQVGKIAIPLDNLKEVLASLKAIETNLSKLSVEIDSLKTELSKLKESQNDLSSNLVKAQNENYKSLEEIIAGINSRLKNISEFLKTLREFELSQTGKINEAIKNLEISIKNIKFPKPDLTPLKKEINFLSSEVAEKLNQIKKLDSKLDFLSTVMRRTMVFFKNLENLGKEAKKFSDQIGAIKKEIKSLKESSEKQLKEIHSKQTTINGLLIVNLILLVLLLFFELERRFRKPTVRATQEKKTEEKEEAEEKGEESEN